MGGINITDNDNNLIKTTVTNTECYYNVNEVGLAGVS